MKRLSRFMPIATDTVLYTAPPDASAVVTSMWIANTDTVARTYRLHIVNTALGESAGVGNAIAYDVSIAASSSVLVQGTRDGPCFVVEPGERIIGRTDTASKVTFTLMGYEVAR